MCRLQNIVMRVWQTDRQTDGRTDDGQSYPYVSLCFVGDTSDTKMTDFYHIFESPDKGYFQTVVHLLYSVNCICYNLFDSIGKVRRCQFSMWLFDVILLWHHNCAFFWQVMWLWRHNEKVCLRVRCRAFGYQTIKDSGLKMDILGFTWK